jgi:hypothetical protein
VGEAVGETGAAGGATKEVPAGPCWARFFPAADVDDSLIPRHVTLAYLQHGLRDRQGWVRLDELLAPGQPRRKRMTQVAPLGRYLRLGDVGPDLMITPPAEGGTLPQPGRVYAEPLSPDEVLLSMLVTSPRVAFAGPEPAAGIHVIDHWERFRFRETPGAWALVLNTAAVRRQMPLLAMGSAQQFTHPESVRGLVLPPVSLDLRLKWDKVLRRCQARHHDLEARWRDLWPWALALYHAAHARPAGRETRP